MPMTEQSKNPVRVLWQQLSLGSVVQFLALFLVATSSTVLGAQKVEIKLVDARSGHPVSPKWVNLGVPYLVNMMPIPADKDGVVRFCIADGDADENVQKRGADRELIGPVVKRTDTFSIQVGYVLCQYRKRDYSWLTRMTFSTKEVLQKGIVMPNTCGKAMASPIPGVVVIFVRPLSWWQIFKQ